MRRILTPSILITIAVAPVWISAQSNAAADAARRWRQQHERAILEEFKAAMVDFDDYHSEDDDDGQPDQSW